MEPGGTCSKRPKTKKELVSRGGKRLVSCLENIAGSLVAENTMAREDASYWGSVGKRKTNNRTTLESTYGHPF